MPVDEDRVNLTEYVPEIYTKMEKGKFYDFLELHNLLWPKVETGVESTIGFVTRAVQLGIDIQILISESKIQTGVRKDYQPHNLGFGQSIHESHSKTLYGIPGKS
jgi:hypothetical protein